MKPRFLATMSFALLMATSISFLFSCSDDDDKDDCAELSSQLSSKSEEMHQAVVDDDCEAIEKAYNDMIDLYQEGHDCDAYKEVVEQAGFDTYTEYIEYLEQIRDVHLSDC